MLPPFDLYFCTADPVTEDLTFQGYVHATEPRGSPDRDVSEGSH